MNIRIVKTPLGDAPPEIREAWVGCSIPLASRARDPVAARIYWGVLSKPRSIWLQIFKGLFFNKRVRGYMVYAMDAVDRLEKRNPAAAAWWREHTPHLMTPNQLLMFREDECMIEVEPPGAA